MRVNFFRIEGRSGASLLSSLQAVRVLANDASRTVDLSGVPYRVHALTVAKRKWLGDISRIRMDDVPVIAGKDGGRKPIKLGEDQGIGEDTAFLYDERKQVLLIQSNRAGVSASKWGLYFESFSADDLAIIPVVVTNTKAASGAIKHLTAVRKIHIRVAGTTNPLLAIDPEGETSNQIRQLANSAPVIELTLGVGHRSRGFSVSNARKLLKALYKKATSAIAGESQQIERIDVVGTFDDDAKVKFDLLEYLVREEVDVPVSRRGKTMLYANRRSGLAEAWNRRRRELTKLFPS